MEDKIVAELAEKQVSEELQLTQAFYMGLLAGVVLEKSRGS